MRKLLPQFVAVVVVAFLGIHASAVTRFVDINSTNAVAPYTNWLTAATNIQDAINAAGSFGDTVLVTNGIYQYGGDQFNGSNRVHVVNGITLASVNGPAVTIIKGSQDPVTTNGVGAVRCVFLQEFAKICGFTLTNGATPQSGVGGGGVATETSCVVSNCIISGNASGGYGGGVSLLGGTLMSDCIICGNVCFSQGGGVNGGGSGAGRAVLMNCVVSNNVAIYGSGVANCIAYNSLLVGNGTTNGYGGGAYESALNNCTIVGNVSRSQGAANICNLNNCIIYYNFNGGSADCYQCGLANCCTTIGFGTSEQALSNNSFSNAPGFVNLAAGDYHLNPWSRCIDAGNSAIATNSVDLDGNPRIVGSAVDIGAYESQLPLQGAAHFVSLHSTNPVTPYTNWSTAATNIQDAVGVAQSGEYVIADDGVYTNSGTIVFGAETNRVVLTNGITLASAGGPQAAIISGAIQTRCAYVGSNSTLVGFTLMNGRGRSGGDITNEQSGSGAWCEIGGTVSNCIVYGNFNLGGGPIGGGIFRGAIYNSTIYSNSAALGAGCALGSYFNCLIVSNAVGFGIYGGGIYGGVASNCTFIANAPYYGVTGGGAYGSKLYNCTLAANFSTYGGGGADSSTLYNCTLIGNQSTTGGGGAHACTNYSCVFLNNYGGNGGAVASGICSGCLISNNLAQTGGGGAFSAILTNCVLAGNRATNVSSLGGGANQVTLFNCLVYSNSAGSGGGLYLGTLLNCTIVGNSAVNGGGTYGSQIYNSVVYYNNAASISSNYSGGSLSFCCTTPAQNGTCFTNAPLLMDLAGRDFHLQASSPCINSGYNGYVTNAFKLDGDFDGNPRIISSAVDVGAYEFPSPASALPYTWLLQYGFAIDGSADGADADGDGMSNYAEWRAKTIPTDLFSVLAVQSPIVTDTNATITWSSVGGIMYYYVQSTPDLFAQPFQSIASNIVGQIGTTSYTDTNAVGGVSLFYRVGVQ